MLFHIKILSAHILIHALLFHYLFGEDFLNAWLVFGLETIITRELYLSSLATTYTA